MAPSVRIYGTRNCPYTRKARDAYGDRAVFVDVESDPKKMEEMLTLSGGRRQVPVIVEGDRVTVGYQGT